MFLNKKKNKRHKVGEALGWIMSCPQSEFDEFTPQVGPKAVRYGEVNEGDMLFTPSGWTTCHRIHPPKDVLGPKVGVLCLQDDKHMLAALATEPGVKQAEQILAELAYKVFGPWESMMKSNTCKQKYAKAECLIYI